MKNLHLFWASGDVSLSQKKLASVKKNLRFDQKTCRVRTSAKPSDMLLLSVINCFFNSKTQIQSYETSTSASPCEHDGLPDIQRIGSDLQTPHTQGSGPRDSGKIIEKVIEKGARRLSF